jgi:hypothetical protein
MERAATFAFDAPTEGVAVMYWQSNGAGETSQTIRQLPGLDASTVRNWSFAADGQAQSFTEMGQDTVRYTYRYNPAGQLTALLAEEESMAYQYDHQPDTQPLQQLAKDLPFWPQLDPVKDTILVEDRQTGDRHWLLLNIRGLLAAYIHQTADGALKAHLVYNYLTYAKWGWAMRAEWNVLSDVLVYNHREGIREADADAAVAKLSSGQWYGLCKYGTRLYLHENGHFVWQEEPGGVYVQGTWQRSGGKLRLQLKNRRQPLIFEEQGEVGAVWLVGEEGKVRPMLALKEDTYAMRQAVAGLEQFSWETLTENNRVGLRHRLDGRALPAQYDAVEVAASDFGIFTLEGLQGVVRYDGQALTPIYYESLELLESDILLAKKSGRYGLIRPNGERILAKEYNRLYYEDGAMRAIENDKMGVIDTSGKVLIPFEYDSLSTTFGPSLRMAWSGNQLGVVHPTTPGWFMSQGPYEQVVHLGSSTLSVQFQSGLWAIWRKAEGFVTDPVYAYMEAVGPNVLLVQQNGQFGLLRKDGSTLVPLQYPLIKACGQQSIGDLCALLAEHNTVAQFISEDGFGYLDGYGREHAPRLPSAARIATDYETVTANDYLSLTFPKEKWRWESSANRLYKQGDYGRVRVFYEVQDMGSATLAQWLQENEPQLYPQMEEAVLGGQEALVASEIKRIRYYDFRKKYAYVPLGKGQVLRLEFSCKAANYIENAQDLYEIERLLEVKP